MKMAIAIQCHRDAEQINKLIDILYDTDIDMYIHVDQKSSIKNDLNKRKNVYLVENSIDVKWGRFSQVEATLSIFKLIKKSNIDYKYIHLISGQDFILVNKEKFKDKFRNCNSEFIEYSKLPNGWSKGGLDRYMVYYPEWMIDRTSKKIKRFTRIVYREFVLRTKIFKRKFTYFNEIYGGSSWFSITGDCFEYIMDYLNNNKSYIDFFKNTLCSDELFFHTLIMNSKFKYNVKNNNLRYIDWNGNNNGSPKDLTYEDIDKAINSNKIFARKINNINVADYIIDIIKEK